MLSTEFFFKKWKYRLLLKGICKKNFFFSWHTTSTWGWSFLLKKLKILYLWCFLSNFDDLGVKMGVLEAMKFVVSTYMFQIWKKIQWSTNFTFQYFCLLKVVSILCFWSYKPAKYVKMTEILLCIQFQLWTIFFKTRTLSKIDFITLGAI